MTVIEITLNGFVYKFEGKDIYEAYDKYKQMLHYNKNTKGIESVKF